MGNVFAEQKAANQVINWTGFTAMRSKHERIQSTFSVECKRFRVQFTVGSKEMNLIIEHYLLAQIVQDDHVGVHVVQVVGVRWIFFVSPQFGSDCNAFEQRRFVFRLIVDRIESGYVRKEFEKIWIGVGVHCNFKQRTENVADHFREIGYQFVALVNVTLKQVERSTTELINI
jgi:hypothetical protein